MHGLTIDPVATILGGLLVLPATPQVLGGLLALADAAPEELSMIANVMPAPPLPFLAPEDHGRLVILATLAYAGDPEAGARALAPLRALAAPLADLVRPMPPAGPGGAARAYVNFLADEGPARVQAAHPEPTWTRLAAIKARRDPPTCSTEPEHPTSHE